MAQILRYKLLLDGTTDITTLFKGGSVRAGVLKAPSAKVQLNNKNFVAEGYLPAGVIHRLDFSGSTDGGATWNNLFSGLVEKRAVSLDATGEREIAIEAYGGYTLRNSYLSPNQIGIGMCDMGKLFTGSNTASDADAWASDSCGNYPNGLLYDTGYKFYGVSDYFTADADVPRRFGFGSDKRLDIINSMVEPYSAIWYLDDLQTPKRFYLLSSSALRAFEPVGATFSVGTDINQYKFSDYPDSVRDSIYVFGKGGSPTAWAVYGNRGREGVVTDDDVSTVQSALAEARLQYSASRDVTDEWDMTVPPQTSSLIGRSVVIRDGTKSWTRSVVGYEHKITTDRWVTELEFERSKLDDVKTIAEITEELYDLERQEFIGESYVHASMSTSPWSITRPEICSWSAVGIGVDPSMPAAIDGGMSQPVMIVPIGEWYTQSTTRAVGNVCFPSRVLSSFDSYKNARVREIGLFATHYTRTRPTIWSTHSTMTLTRPTSDWYSDTGIYDSKITKTLDEGLFRMDLMDATVVSTNSAWRAFYTVPNNANQCRFVYSCSDWANAHTLLTLSSAYWESFSSAPDGDKLGVMSIDDRYNLPTMSAATLSGVVNGDGVFFHMQVRGGMNPTSYDTAYTYLKSLKFVVHGRAFTGSGIATTAYAYAYYDGGPLGGTQWLGIGSLASTSTTPTTFSLSAASFGLRNHVDDGGCFNFAIKVPGITGASPSKLVIQNVYVVQEWAKPSQAESSTGERIVTRRCKLIDGDTGYFEFPERPKKIVGVFLSGSYPGGVFDSNSSENFISRWSFDETVIDVDERLDSTFQGTARVEIGKKKTGYMAFKHLSNLRETFTDLIRKQGYAHIQYITDFKYAFEPAQKVSMDAFTKLAYTDYGSYSTVNLDIAKLPPWGLGIQLNYSAVGPAAWTAGCVGRAVFTTSDASNSCRDGVDMDGNKNLNVHFEYNWNGFGGYVVPPSASAHGGTVHRPPNL